MTYYEVYKKGKNILKNVNNQDFEFDAMVLLEYVFKLDKRKLIINSNHLADKQNQKLYFNLINERANGRPLQYIIGEWEFMGLKFKVGEGVLIPRYDTECLIIEVAKIFEGKKKLKILDLCAGSGTVCISLASKFCDSEVYAVEISDVAYDFLCYNIKMNRLSNVKAFRGNIFELPNYLSKNEKFDLIVSNPPYIQTKDIDNLQKEVRLEPKIALDGGLDGLDFYRRIASFWKNYLKSDGTIAVEIGVGQSKDILNIFKKNGFNEILIKKDLNDIDRVVLAKF